MCTTDPSKAHEFPTRLAAILDSTRHYGLMMYEAIEREAAGEGKKP